MSDVRRFAANSIQVSDIGSDFLKLTIYAITDGLNRNSSAFTLESMKDAIPTIPNKPVLAYYNPIVGDTESHNLQIRQDYKTGEYYESFDEYGAEHPVGLIPTDSNIRIENINGRNWLVVDCLIWNNYNRNLVKLLKKQRKKSVSVEVQVLESVFTDEIETIQKFRWHGITILGDTISPGITGAHLDLDEFAKSERFNQFSKALTFAYTGKDEIDTLEKKGGEILEDNEKFVAKNELGSSGALTINTSTEGLSNSAWGDVDKSKLKKTCLKASNYKSVCPKVFLKLEDGWDEGKEGSLGYPVMQLKDDTLVYNRAGLASALAYATQHNEKSVLTKLKAIYSKLGLNDKKEEDKMKNSAKKYGYSIFGQNDNHLFLLKDNKTYSIKFDDKAGDDDGDEEKFKAQLVPVGIQAKMEDDSEEVFAIRMEEVKMEDDSKEKMDALEKAKMEAETAKMEAEEKMKKMEEDSKVKMEEADRTKMEESDAKLKKMEEEKMALEEKCAKMEEAYKKMEDDAKAAKMSALMEEVKNMADTEKLDAKDFEEVKVMAEEGKFASKVDAEKEIVYRSHLKKNEGLKLGIFDKGSKSSKTSKTVFEDLKETVKLVDNK